MDVTAMKTNCWDYVNCDKEVRKSCPVYTMNQGYKCWKVASSMALKGSAGRPKDCSECDFYKYASIHPR